MSRKDPNLPDLPEDLQAWLETRCADMDEKTRSWEDTPDARSRVWGKLAAGLNLPLLVDLPANLPDVLSAASGTSSASTAAGTAATSTGTATAAAGTTATGAATALSAGTGVGTVVGAAGTTAAAVGTTAATAGAAAAVGATALSVGSTVAGVVAGLTVCTVAAVWIASDPSPVVKEEVAPAPVVQPERMPNTQETRQEADVQDDPLEIIIEPSPLPATPAPREQAPVRHRPRAKPSIPVAPVPDRADEPVEPQPDPPVSVEPSAPPQPPETAVTPDKPAQEMPAVPAATRQAEQKMLHQARKLLASGQPAAALELLERHAVLHSGLLAEERDALRVLCLVALGRESQARAAASAFSRAYPESLMWPAIQEALGRAP